MIEKLHKAVYVSVFLLSYLFSTAQWSSDWAPYYRHANSVIVYSNQKAIIAGGNQNNDSIQSVFTTTDRAVSWNINLDILKSWLKSVSMVSKTGFVAVGNRATIIKSTDGGDNWTSIPAPVNSEARHFNAVHFVDTGIGYIAGGWLANDSIQTILKTIDGGASWSVQRDSFGYWLTSISFSNATNGVAVGSKGTVLRTTDGGANWNKVALTGNIANRDFTKVYFTTATTGFIVGGNRSNDSIQTILKTTNGGANWSIIRDNLGPMLNGIDFASATQAYAVGDRGEALISNDAGNSWTPLNLPYSLTDTFNLLAVDFINEDFGLITGRFGKIVRFANLLPTVPTVITESASKVSVNSAQLNATVNANGTFAKLRFEYGLSQNLGNVIAADVDTVFGSVTTAVFADLSSLTPNTFYYYRIVADNKGGDNEGEINSFYTADCTIPNCDFEVWDTIVFDVPKQWTRVGNIRKGTSYDSSDAVELFSGAFDRAGGVVYGDISDDQIRGGLKLNGTRPDSLVFYAKYDIVAGDTAFGVAIFKLNGQISHIHFAPITGSSGNNFVRISSPIIYTSADIPDSVIVGVVSTNAFNDGIKIWGSAMTVDNIVLTGITDSLPNANFEEWEQELFDYPADWETSETGGSKVPFDQVAKVTDCISGRYAIKIANNIDYTNTTEIRGIQHSDSSPAFPVGGRHSTFNFYTKYTPQNNDTFFVNITMFKNGAHIGGCHAAIDTSISGYTPISIPINYANSTDVPDSAQVSFRLGGQVAFGSSVAYIDNLSFDGFRNPAVYTPPSKVDEGNKLSNLLLKVYPNPAASDLTVEYFNAQGTSKIVISDLQGKRWSYDFKDMQNGMVKTQIDIRDFAEGIYFITVPAGSVNVTRRFAIVR